MFGEGEKKIIEEMDTCVYQKNIDKKFEELLQQQEQSRSYVLDKTSAITDIQSTKVKKSKVKSKVKAKSA